MTKKREEGNKESEDIDFEMIIGKKIAKKKEKNGEEALGRKECQNNINKIASKK